MTVSVGIVPKELLDDVWPVAFPLLAPAIRRSGERMSDETVRQSLEGHSHLLWLASEDDTVYAAFITRSAQYPLKKMLVVESLGGFDMKRWVGVVNETLITFARKTDHDGLELYGREGWARALIPYGWNRSMVVCEINFDQEKPDV